MGVKTPNLWRRGVRPLNLEHQQMTLYPLRHVTWLNKVSAGTSIYGPNSHFPSYLYSLTKSNFCFQAQNILVVSKCVSVYCLANIALTSMKWSRIFAWLQLAQRSCCCWGSLEWPPSFPASLGKTGHQDEVGIRQCRTWEMYAIRNYFYALLKKLITRNRTRP